MTAKDKALEIMYVCCQDNEVAKECVKQITSALESYGQDTDELQNMEQEMRFWDRVYYEIDKI